MAAEIKIGRDVYRCEPLPAADSLALFGRACNLFGPETLAAVKSGLDRKGASEEYVVLCCAQGADVEALNKLIVDLAQLTTIGPDKAIVGVHPESMEDTIELAFWVLGVQFGRFLGVALAGASNAPSGQAA